MQARRGMTAAAVVAVVLLCQATAWVHAATPHVTCLEHGESVHLPVAPTAAAPVGSRARDIRTIEGLAESSAHAHEHCSLQGQRTTTAAAHSRQAVRATEARPSRAAAAEPARALRLLSLAPKTSPPRSPVS
jgi:hypothetical protein